MEFLPLGVAVIMRWLPYTVTTIIIEVPLYRVVYMYAQGDSLIFYCFKYSLEV